MDNVSIWKHPGFWSERSKQFAFCNDGIHLNINTSYPKYYNSIPAAVVSAPRRVEKEENEWQEDLPATDSISTSIAAMVDPGIKHKIWQDKYIDLSVLLPQNCLPNAKKNGLQFQVSRNSTLSLGSNKPRFYISSIEQWTTAFLRFMAIYSEKCPESTAYLAKHAEIVRDLASTQSSNNSWLTYDQQVRMDRQIRGVPWHSLNMEFYIMAPRPQQGSQQGNRPFRPFRNRQWNSSNRQEESYNVKKKATGIDTK
ncbi:uncharacterized protein LOC134697875 [Mytilus trossulus]|uniref:uncharacterized protein LOC134697875 n=1 Tax=Mytilus trossulus TaxID=6551 RepID=UPI003003EC93